MQETQREGAAIFDFIMQTTTQGKQTKHTIKGSEDNKNPIQAGIGCCPLCLGSFLPHEFYFQMPPPVPPPHTNRKDRAVKD